MSGFAGVAGRFAERHGKQPAEVFGLLAEGLKGEPEAIRVLRKNYGIDPSSMGFFGARVILGKIQTETPEEREKAGKALLLLLNVRFHEKSPDHWGRPVKRDPPRRK